MELVPALELGWLNGWTLIFLLYVTYSILLLTFPKDVVTKLYDRSGRTERQKMLIRIGGLLAFAYFVQFDTMYQIALV